MSTWRHCQEHAAGLLGVEGTGAIHEIARGMGYKVVAALLGMSGGNTYHETISARPA